MSPPDDRKSIVGGTSPCHGGLHQTKIPRGHWWARALKGSESLRPVARDVRIGCSVEVVGGAVPRVAKEHG